MCGFLTLWGVGALNPSIVQGSTVYAHEDRFYLGFLFSQSYLRMWLCVPLCSPHQGSWPTFAWAAVISHEEEGGWE